MDAISCPTTATTPLRRFSPPDSSKRWKSHLWAQSSLSFAPTRRAIQLLVSGTMSNAHKGNILQVLCSKKSEVPVLEARFMYEVYDALAERLLPNVAAASYPNLKHIVGLAGPPGAGKSTVASEVVQRVNKLWPQKAPSFAEEVNSPDVATVLPMDGFHLYHHQLDAMDVCHPLLQILTTIDTSYRLSKIYF